MTAIEQYVHEPTAPRRPANRRRLLKLRAHYERTGFRPHPGQWRVLRNRSRHLVVPCGRRWGKTIAGAKRIEPRCLILVPDMLNGGMRGQQFWIVGPTYTDAEREFGHLYDGLRKLGVDKHSIRWPKVPRGEGMHLVTSWGLEVWGKSAQYPKSLVGEGLDGVLMVEAGRHRRSTWASYIRPTLSDNRGWSMHTGVPEGSRRSSLLYALAQRGLSERPDDHQWATYHAPSWENNVVFPLGRDDPEILEAAADLTDDEFQNQYGAKWVDHAGVVMKDWDDELHLADLDYNPSLPLFWCLDYGFRNDFVVLWVQVDQFGHTYVIDEMRRQGMTAEEVAAELKVQPLTRRVAGFYPDPARPDNTATIQRETGVQARGGTGGELIPRLESIWRLLKPRGMDHPHYKPGDEEVFLQIDRNRCRKLAFEFSEGYRWPELRSEVRAESELPVKKDDHGIEALGRFTHPYFQALGQGPQQTSQRANMRGRRPDPKANGRPVLRDPARMRRGPRN